MKIKFGLLSIAVLLVLTGCLNNQSEIVQQKEKTTTEQEKEIVVSEDILTLDEVKKAIEAEEIELHPKDEPTDWILNKIKPNRFSIMRPTEKAKYAEFISIYVYDSEKARKAGLDDFNIQKEKYDMQIPNIYEHKNVLILYWHHENQDNAKNTKFGKSIETAIQKL